MAAQGNTYCYISDLPDEILELIFTMISPYRDFKHVMLVCHRWKIIMRGVISRFSWKLQQTLEHGGAVWSYHRSAGDLTIMARYAHSACYYNRALYVFGGCTSNATTFNDLWKFDLVEERWFRPLATGPYPSPKAWASMVAYRQSLILFGGWSSPTPITFHQASRFFNQLHLYNPAFNEWTQITSQNCPEGTAGHGASIIGDNMIVFGGSHRFEYSCNDVLVLNLKDWTWRKQSTSENKPRPRFSHSQVVIDDCHILILGGCGGANMQFSDAWLLTLASKEVVWYWQEISIVNRELAAPQLWSHPACKVGGKLVVLSKNQKIFNGNASQALATSKCKMRPWNPGRHETSRNASQSVQKNVESYSGSSVSIPPETNKRSSPRLSNDNEQRSLSTAMSTTGTLPLSSVSLIPAGNISYSSHLLQPSFTPNYVSCKESSGSSSCMMSSPAVNSQVRSGMPCVRPNAMKNRQHQLETLKKYEEKFRVAAHSQMRCSSLNPIYVHAVDLSHVLTDGSISWLPIQKPDSSLGPEETTFYSLVEGRGELILFGGICGDLHTMERGGLPAKTQNVSNSIYYLSFTKHAN